MDTDTFDICDCDWVADEDTKTCGCGEKHCRLYRDNVIHWDGVHWLYPCALKAAIEKMESRPTPTDHDFDN